MVTSQSEEVKMSPSHMHSLDQHVSYLFLTMKVKKKNTTVDWSRHCATNQKVERSISDGALGIFQ
jgi:hypothetical protein